MLYNHNVKTYNIKLVFSSDNDLENLRSTLILQNEIWNHLSEFVYTSQSLNKKLLHDNTYYQARSIFRDALAQMFIRAEHDVVAAYKSARSNGISWKEISEKDPFKKKRLSIRLDKRLYSMTRSNIILSTINGRITCGFVLYNRIEEMFKSYSVCDPLIFERDGEFFLSVSVNKRVATVNPYNTSRDDHRGIKSGVRKGCRYHASDGLVFDADWNAAVNIANRYAEISGLPVSFYTPHDGGLNFIVRLSQEPIVSEVLKTSCGKLRDFSPCSN